MQNYILNLLDSMLILTLIVALITATLALINSDKVQQSQLVVKASIVQVTAVILSLAYFQPHLISPSSAVLDFPLVIFANVSHFLLPLYLYQLVASNFAECSNDRKILTGYLWVTLLVCSFFALRALFPGEAVCASSVHCSLDPNQPACQYQSFCVVSNLVGIASIFQGLFVILLGRLLYSHAPQFNQLDGALRLMILVLLTHWLWRSISAMLIGLEQIAVDSTTFFSMLLGLLGSAVLLIWLLRQQINTLLQQSLQHSKEEALIPADIEGKLKRLNAYISENQPQFEKNITLTRLAEAVGLARNDLSFLINQHYGLSFSEFINSQRINKAKELLTEPDSDKSIQDIYMQVGFNSKTTFNTVFKKATGKTPSAYREQQD